MSHVLDEGERGSVKHLAVILWALRRHPQVNNLIKLPIDSYAGSAYSAQSYIIKH